MKNQIQIAEEIVSELEPFSDNVVYHLLPKHKIALQSLIDLAKRVEPEGIEKILYHLRYAGMKETVQAIVKYLKGEER